jgi:hypothetical protein
VEVRIAIQSPIALILPDLSREVDSRKIHDNVYHHDPRTECLRRLIEFFGLAIADDLGCTHRTPAVQDRAVERIDGYPRLACFAVKIGSLLLSLRLQPVGVILGLFYRVEWRDRDADLCKILSKRVVKTIC